LEVVSRDNRFWEGIWNLLSEPIEKLHEGDLSNSAPAKYIESQRESGSPFRGEGEAHA
tara:strand:+ start:2810 stop:2983 length:174 start_codon:yes stop_codon:yes gene_type:complete